MKSLTETAIQFIGARQGGAQHRKIVDGYNTIRPLPRGYRVSYKDNWCATFVSDMIRLAGGDTSLAECSANRLRKKLEKYQTSDRGQKDDIIFYDWNGDKWSDHVGIIVSEHNGVYKVIEGNKNKTVGYRYIAVNNNDIQSICRLNDEAKKNTHKAIKAETDKKTYINNSKRITKKLVADVIAGKYGNGQERKEKLKKAGYDPDKVQEAVNKMI